jgi:hypothetical protein
LPSPQLRHNAHHARPKWYVPRNTAAEFSVVLLNSAR